jgi:hypothetical protein
MKSFSSLSDRLDIITEARVSPYAKSHPAFADITKKMKVGGLSSAPLDTIRFIRETLYMLGLIDDEELAAVKKGKGFSGKKQAMLSLLQSKQDIINKHSDEIAARVTDTLDDFIGGVGVNRSREEKYAAQAAAVELANQMRQANSGKEMDDALADVIDSETIVVRASVAKILGDINRNLGDPGFDIEQMALDEVIEFSKKIDTVAKLKSFVQQISAEPGYEKIAAYLSSAIKPIQAGTEDEEMEDIEEDQEDVDGFDLGQSDDEIPPQYEEPCDDEDNEQMISDAEYLDEYTKDRSAFDVSEPEGVPGSNGEYTRRVIVSIDDKVLTDLTCMFSLDDSLMSCKPSDNSDGEYDDIYADKIARIIQQHRYRSSGEDIFSNAEDGDVDIFNNSEDNEDSIESLSDSDLINYAHSEGIEEHLIIDGEGGLVNRDEIIKLLSAEDAEEDGEEANDLHESYTSNYMTDQRRSDKYTNKSKEQYRTFGEHFNPKTSWQLEEMNKRGYGRY